MADTAYIKCPKCKGRGYLLDITPYFAVVTLGLTALLEWSMSKDNICDMCEGDTVLWVDE